MYLAVLMRVLVAVKAYIWSSYLLVCSYARITVLLPVRQYWRYLIVISNPFSSFHKNILRFWRARILLWSQLNAKISLSFKRDFENDHTKLRILVDSRLENQRIWLFVLNSTINVWNAKIFSWRQNTTMALHRAISCCCVLEDYDEHPLEILKLKAPTMAMIYRYKYPSNLFRLG